MARLLKDREDSKAKTEVVLEEEIIKAILDKETYKEISEEETDLKEDSESDKNLKDLFIILEAILVKFFRFIPWFL